MTINCALAFGFLLVLFGCDRAEDRYQSADDHENNLTSQVAMTPQTMDKLRGYGVTPDTQLRLEFFFYTNSERKAAELAEALKARGYDVEHRKAANDDLLFVVNGWTSPVQMETSTVVDWTKDMCTIGYAHDAEFDGWSTNPNQ